MTEGKPGEKVLPLLIVASLTFFILQVARAIDGSGDQQITSLYRLLIIVMMALLAVSVYALIKMLT